MESVVFRQRGEGRGHGDDVICLFCSVFGALHRVLGWDSGFYTEAFTQIIIISPRPQRSQATFSFLHNGVERHPRPRPRPVQCMLVIKMYVTRAQGDPVPST